MGGVEYVECLKGARSLYEWVPSERCALENILLEAQQSSSLNNKIKINASTLARIEKQIHDDRYASPEEMSFFADLVYTAGNPICGPTFTPEAMEYLENNFADAKAKAAATSVDTEKSAIISWGLVSGGWVFALGAALLGPPGWTTDAIMGVGFLIFLVGSGYTFATMKDRKEEQTTTFIKGSFNPVCMPENIS